MDASRLDLNLLVALEALMAERNVTRAAARLHISQPALSARLARLRDAFGDPLLLPARRGLTPTPRALELEGPLARALDEVRRVAAAGTAFDPATARMTVTVAASDYVQVVLLIDLGLRLRRAAPGLRLAMRAIDGRRVGAQAERGEVDLALMTTSTVPPGLRADPLFEESYKAIARRGHPRICDAPGAGLALDAFAAEDHVVVSPRGGTFSTAADEALAAHGAARRVVMSAASFLFVPEIVARSDLVALVPARLVRDRAGQLSVFDPPVPVPGFAISAVWHDRTHDHPGHAWLRDQLQRLAALP